MKFRKLSLPVSLTDWALAIPAKFHCPLLTKFFGRDGHDWVCFVCDPDDEPEDAKYLYA